MKKLFLNFFTIAAVASTFVACNPEGNEPSDKTETKVADGSAIPTEIDENEVVILDGKTFKLEGSVIVPEGAELHINAGTTINATGGFDSYILICRGAKIYAEGTADAPILFQSGNADKKPADWGGLIINGKAPIAGETAGMEGNTEINSTVKYGGVDVADNSGVVKYVKLFHTGASTSGSAEHNGLTLNAVGNGTVIENLYISEATDDAVEFFGGSVNVTNLLAVNSQDDMFDFTQGFSGKLTNAYAVWEADYVSDEEDPRGIEADGNLDGKTPNDKGQSNFTIQNVTFDNRKAFSGVNGSGNGEYEDKIHAIVKIRRGATGKVINALLVGEDTKGDLVDLVDKKGAATNATSVSITSKIAEVTNLVLSKSGNYNDKDYNYVVPESCVSVVASNTGCDKANFGWTKYNF